MAQITTSIVEGEPDETVGLTQQSLEAGVEPLAIIGEGLVPGMNTVGADGYAEDAVGAIELAKYLLS